MRKLYTLLCVILIVIIGFIISIYFLLATYRGSTITLFIIAKILPGTIYYSNLEGTLLNNFTIHNFIYINSSVRVEIDHLYIAWRPNHLLSYKLDIAKLAAQNAKININKLAKPFVIQINQLKLEDIVAYYSDNKLNLHFTINGNIQYGKMHGALSGNLGKYWNIYYQVKNIDISQFYNNVIGVAHLEGRIQGEQNRPQIISKLAFNKLYLFPYQKAFYQGNLIINTTASLLEKDLPIETDIHFQNTAILYTYHKKTTHYPINGNIHLILQKNSLQSKAVLSSIQNDRLFINFNLPQGFNAHSAINGNINLRFSQFQILPNLFPQIGYFQGILTSNVNIAGTLANPQLAGSSQIIASQLKIKALGITLKSINFIAKLRDNALDYIGNLRSGEGYLKITGHSSISKKITTTLTVDGENFLISDTSST